MRIFIINIQIQNLMHKSQNEDDDVLPAWHHQKPSPEIKEEWKKAVEDYLLFHEAEPEDLLHSKELVMDLIPFVKKHDTRWKGFKVT